MDKFASLMLRASQAFGAPAYLAKAIGYAPRDIYRWIAGVDQPGPAEREHLELLLRGVLAQKPATATGRRRWVDREEARI